MTLATLSTDTKHEYNFCLQVNNQYVFSTIGDRGLIGKWAVDSALTVAKPIGEFNHGSQITCLQLTDNYLISGGLSDEETVKVWDYRTGECLKTLSHGYWVSSLCVIGNTLFTGGFNGTIMMWDLKSGDKTVIATTRPREKIDQMQFVRGSLVVSGYRIFEFNHSEEELDDHNIPILQEVAETLKLFDYPRTLGIHKYTETIDIFGRLPPKHRHPIYGELYAIKTPAYFDALGKNHLSCGEEAFHGENELRSTCGERAGAITNYLSKISKK